MVTSDYPKIMASHGLLLETVRAEANHAAVKDRIDELARHYAAQERQAIADLDEKLRAIDAQFEKQRAEIADQLQQSLRVSIERVLSQNRDHEIAVLQQAYQRKADERKRRYDEQKRIYDKELFTAITALMSAGSALGPGRPPTLSSQPSDDSQTSPAAAASELATSVQTGRSPPTAAKIPLQSQPVPSPLSTHSLMQTPIRTSTEIRTETGGRPILPRSYASDDVQTKSPQNLGVHSHYTPSHPRQLPSEGEHESGRFASPAKSQLEQAAKPTPVPERKSLPSAPGNRDGRQDQRSLPPKPSPRPDSAHKRKANGEVNDSSLAAASSRLKRARLEKASNADNSAAATPSPTVSQATSERMVSFEDVYGAPGKPVLHKHIIVQYPLGTGDFYILRCDEHGVHFGEHPLRGAAKHLASAQHGFMSKAHVTAIETLGHRVVGCTKEMAEKNNHAVLKAFKDGYKVFNANNLSQAKRAELGYPPFDPLNSQKVAMHRKQTAGVANPVVCRFYVATNGDLKCPVLILPWGDMSPAGLSGTLADTNIFFPPAHPGGESTGVPKLPNCYDYDFRESDGQVFGIRGWEKGYETGGPLERKREFPVLCVGHADRSMWTVGWVKARHLSPLDFDDPNSRVLPFFKEAREYFLTRVLRQGSVREAEGPDAYEEDVEMKEAGTVQFEGDSDVDSVGKGVTDSENGVGRAEEESRRTSVSNRDEFSDESKSREDTAKSTAASTTAAASTATNAQLIAAQALNLQAPARSGFTAINSAGTAESSTSPSARASLEPPSRAGSVSSTGGGHRRVFKIHARSSTRHPTNQTSPSMVLPERPVDGAMSPNGASNQSQNDTRRPSPASLQNILQDFPAAVGPPRVDSPSPKPAGARRPLPSAPMRGSSPSSSGLLSTVNTKVTESPRDSRAGSAPVQSAQHRDPVAEEIRRSGSASVAPDPSRHATPQPALAPAPAAAPAEAAQRREQPPPPIQLPPPPATLPTILHLSNTPLATPTASAGNTRANSPSLAQPKIGTPTAASFPGPETPTLTPTLTQPSAFVPTMDVFDIAGFMEGSTEVFRSDTPGQHLRLIDDHQSGVFTTPSDAPVSLKLEPKKIKTVERASAPGGPACVVTITYRPEEGEEGEGRTQTLVLEKARSTASGMLNGVAHARRLCRRLTMWNGDIVCPSPSNSLDSVQWRFNDSPTLATPPASSAAVAAPLAEEEEPK